MKNLPAEDLFFFRLEETFFLLLFAPQTGVSPTTMESFQITCWWWWFRYFQGTLINIKVITSSVLWSYSDSVSLCHRQLFFFFSLWKPLYEKCKFCNFSLSSRCFGEISSDKTTKVTIWRKRTRGKFTVIQLLLCCMLNVRWSTEWTWWMELRLLLVEMSGSENECEIKVI